MFNLVFNLQFVCNVIALLLTQYVHGSSFPRNTLCAFVGVVVAGKTTISNDGATIMKQLDVAHPAAKTLVDISLSQDAEVL